LPLQPHRFSPPLIILLNKMLLVNLILGTLDGLVWVNTRQVNPLAGLDHTTIRLMCNITADLLMFVTCFHYLINIYFCWKKNVPYIIICIYFYSIKICVCIVQSIVMNTTVNKLVEFFYLGKIWLNFSSWEKLCWRIYWQTSV